MSTIKPGTEVRVDGNGEIFILDERFGMVYVGYKNIPLGNQRIAEIAEIDVEFMLRPGGNWEITRYHTLSYLEKRFILGRLKSDYPTLYMDVKEL